VCEARASAVAAAAAAAAADPVTHDAVFKETQIRRRLQIDEVDETRRLRVNSIIRRTQNGS
jgi:hypothetical protein